MVLLGAGCWVGRILRGGVWVLGGCSCGCGLVGGCWAVFFRLGRLFMAALLVLDEDLAHELRWAGDLLTRLQLDVTDKQKN